MALVYLKQKRLAAKRRELWMGAHRSPPICSPLYSKNEVFLCLRLLCVAASDKQKRKEHGARNRSSGSSVGGFEQCAADGNETQSLQRRAARCHFLRSLTCIMLTYRVYVCIYGHCTHTDSHSPPVSPSGHNGCEKGSVRFCLCWTRSGARLL